MYSLVYKLYFMLKRHERILREKGKVRPRLLKRMIDYCEWYYNVIAVKGYRTGNKGSYSLDAEKRGKKVIASLTSHPGRIDTVWITIETLFRQSVKPDEIILWLADTQFKGVDDLPENLKQQQDRGLTIRFCDDLKSHKKYFYVLQENIEDIVILFDDDMFYPYDTIQKLLVMHERYPENICTITAQMINPSAKEEPSKWFNPPISVRFEDSREIQIFTGSGSLYPPHTFSEEAFNKQNILGLCPSADDLWLTFMAMRENVRVTALYPWRAFPIEIYGTARNSLWFENAQNGKNDLQWKALLKTYGREVLEAE